MSEQNKMLMRRGIEEVWNRGNFDVADELLANDFCGHSSMAETRGPNEVKQFFGSLRSAFPDIHFTIEDEIAEGDKVVVRWSARATHTGDFRGIPPTGKQGEIMGITINRIVNGKTIEAGPASMSWGCCNNSASFQTWALLQSNLLSSEQPCE